MDDKPHALDCWLKFQAERALVVAAKLETAEALNDATAHLEHISDELKLTMYKESVRDAARSLVRAQRLHRHLVRSGQVKIPTACDFKKPF